MAHDTGRGSSRLFIDAATSLVDSGGHYSIFQVEKWDDDQIAYARRKLEIPSHLEPSARSFGRLKVKPFETYVKEDCNLITDAGWQLMMNGVGGSAITKFSGTVGRIGGGVTSTAAAYTNTDLAAATGAASRQWELLSATPTVGSTHTAGLVFAATFPTTDGNFAWAEFGIDQGTASGTGASTAVFFERGIASPGTKTSAQTWNATVTITWT